MGVDDMEKKQKGEKKKKRNKHETQSSGEDKRHKKKKAKTTIADGDIHSDSVKKHKAKKRSVFESAESRKQDIKSRKLSNSDQSQSNPKQQNKRMRKRKDKFKDKVPDFLSLLKTKPPVIEEEPKLTPKTPEDIALEKMKDEKRERMRKKRQTKKENKGKKIESTVAKDAALQYLTLWHTHKEIWRFQKVRQTWLLGHMYDTDKVSDSNFDVLLKYLEDLKGHSKEMTIEQAEKILAVAEDQEEEEEEEEEHDPHDNSEDEEEKGDQENEKEGQEEEEKTLKKQKTGTQSNNKEDVTSSVKYQRARQVLQILA